MDRCIDHPPDILFLGYIRYHALCLPSGIPDTVHHSGDLLHIQIRHHHLGALRRKQFRNGPAHT
ncbi:hypothetical protein D3C81_2301610 [compost metagenome]